MTTLNPHEAAEKMMTLSEEQSRLIGRIIELEEEEANFFRDYRVNYKSDKAVTMAWSVTNTGIETNRIKWKLKAIKSELSTIKNYLRHAENEARNIY